MSTVFSYHYGALLHRSTFRGGFGRVQFHLTEEDRQNHADLYALIDRIPADASVAATENEAPHVSARADCFTVRVAIYDADYILVDLRAAQHNIDKKHVDAALATGKYGFVAAHGHFGLWAKGYSHADDAVGARLLGHKPKED